MQDMSSCNPKMLKTRAAWIMMRSATDLSKADLHVFSKLFDDGLERGQEAKAFSGRQIGGHDDVLDFFVGHLSRTSDQCRDDAATSAVIGRWRFRRRLFARRHRRRRTTSSWCAWSAARRALRRRCRYRT